MHACIHTYIHTYIILFARAMRKHESHRVCVKIVFAALSVRGPPLGEKQLEEILVRRLSQSTPSPPPFYTQGP